MLKFKVKKLVAVSLFAFVLFPCFGMESVKIETLEPQPSLSHQFCDFARQRVSGLYYTTSVVGYSSHPEPMSDFLRNKFKEGWVQREINRERKLPLPGEDGFKEIEFVLRCIPDRSIVASLKQNSVYQYLYKEDNNIVNIILLHNVSTIIAEINKDETHLFHVQNPYYFHVPYSWCDLSKNESYYLSTSECLSQICNQFNNKSIKIHTLIRSEESASSNLSTRVVSILNGMPVISHFTYAQMVINADRESMAVKVIDPTFDTEQPYVNTIFGSLDPLSRQSERMFQKIANNLGIQQLQHAYHYRGDQVVNFQDCGRFSIIYLLSEMEESNALGLSNYDVYQGFKILEIEGYHRFHETKTQTLPIPQVQSWFSWGVGGPRRAICNFLLDNVL